MSSRQCIVNMNHYLITQVFTAVIALILGVTFFTLLIANSATHYQRYQEFLVPLLLIMVIIVLLAVFSVLSKMAYHIEEGRGRRKK